MLDLFANWHFKFAYENQHILIHEVLAEGYQLRLLLGLIGNGRLISFHSRLPSIIKSVYRASKRQMIQ